MKFKYNFIQFPFFATISFSCVLICFLNFHPLQRLFITSQELSFDLTWLLLFFVSRTALALMVLVKILFVISFLSCNSMR